MEQALKNAIKALIKKAIPKKKLIGVIKKAEALKEQGATSVERFNIAVDLMLNRLPFPFSVLACIGKKILIEAVQEAIQETFDELKSEGSL